MRIEVVTAPQSPDDEPFSVATAKEHLIVEHTDDDTYIGALISAVHEAAKKITNRAIMTSTYAFYLDDFPKGSAPILLPRGKVGSVSSVKYFPDDTGVYSTWDSSSYETDLIGTPARVRPKNQNYYPITWDALNAVKVEYIVGYTQSTLPKSLKQAMLMHLSHFYEVRQPIVVGTIYSRVPFTLEALYAPWRIPHFS